MGCCGVRIPPDAIVMADPVADLLTSAPMSSTDPQSQRGSHVRRVVQILPQLDDGGVERGVVELSRELVARGIESWVISHGGAQIPSIVEHGGHHVSLDVCSKNPLTAWWRAHQLKTALNDINPDVIHARSRLPAWLCRIANRNPRRPFVTTVHGLNSINPYSRVMVTGDRVIAVGESVKEHVCQGYGLDPASVRVIQRGVDLNAFQRSGVDQAWTQEFCHEYGLVDRYVVSSIGRVTELKDFETFIRSIAQCAATIPDITGLIVGGVRPNKQDYLKELQQLARDEGVSDRIIFAGSQSQMPEIYALSDILVNASLKMGNMGRTVVEALAMETPVIATTWPGLKNLVRDGVNGQVIENQNPEQMTQAILQIREASYATPERRGTIRQSVPYEYTLDAMVEQVVEVYESVVES